MIRVLILFLTFLLPMQVFASGIDAQMKLAQQGAQQIHTGPASAHHDQQDQQSSQPDLHSSFLDIADLMAYQTDVSDDCCAFGDDATEFNLHADLSDEPVPATSFRFMPNLSPLTLASGNDSVREPPFLPLISPPPRA